MRCDLPPPQQAVQACHACIEMARTLLPPGDEHPHLVLCGVRSELQLRKVLRHLERIEVAFRTFFEPDLEGQLTAVATEVVRGELRDSFRRYQCLRGPDEPR